MTVSKNKETLTPDFIRQSKKTLLRTERRTILFNKKELAVIDQYCDKFNIKSKSAFFRESIVSAVLQQLDDSSPKLF